MVLENLEWVAEPGQEPYGIQVGLEAESVLLRNVDLRGFANPVELAGHDELLQNACKICSLAIEDSRFVGPGPNVLAATAIHAITPDSHTRNVRLDNVSITGFTQGVLVSDAGMDATVEFKTVIVDCVRDGIRVDAGFADFRNVTVLNCRGVGVRLAVQEAAMANLHVAGNWLGIELGASQSLRLSGALIQDNAIGGLHLLGNGQMTVQESTIQRNGGGTEGSAYEEAGFPDLRYGAFAQQGPSSWTSNCISSNPGWGLFADPLAADVQADDNWWGDSTGPRRFPSSPRMATPSELDVLPGGDFVSAEVPVMRFNSAASSQCP